MLAAACNRVPDDGAHETKHDRTDGYPFRCPTEENTATRIWRLISRCKPNDRADPSTNQ